MEIKPEHRWLEKAFEEQIKKAADEDDRLGRRPFAMEKPLTVVTHFEK